MPELFEFVPGRIYNRREDLHDRFGGQQQGGIITPSRHDVVFIITGDGGAAYGYNDRIRPDGVMEYYGEGQRGDMQLVRGNLAISQHLADEKSLLLFEKEAEGLRFVGAKRYAGHRVERGQDVEGNMRDVIVFLLEEDQD